MVECPRSTIVDGVFIVVLPVVHGHNNGLEIVPTTVELHGNKSFYLYYISEEVYSSQFFSLSIAMQSLN